MYNILYICTLYSILYICKLWTVQELHWLLIGSTEDYVNCTLYNILYICTLYSILYICKLWAVQELHWLLIGSTEDVCTGILWNQRKILESIQRGKKTVVFYPGLDWCWHGFWDFSVDKQFPPPGPGPLGHLARVLQTVIGTGITTTIFNLDC